MNTLAHLEKKKLDDDDDDDDFQVQCASGREQLSKRNSSSLASFARRQTSGTKDRDSQQASKKEEEEEKKHWRPRQKKRGSIVGVFLVVLAAFCAVSSSLQCTKSTKSERPRLCTLCASVCFLSLNLGSIVGAGGIGGALLAEFCRRRRAKVKVVADFEARSGEFLSSILIGLASGSTFASWLAGWLLQF